MEKFIIYKKGIVNIHIEANTSNEVAALADAIETANIMKVEAFLFIKETKSCIISGRLCKDVKRENISVLLDNLKI